MQKFTIFSVILSLSVVLVIGDLVLHDYVNDNPWQEAAVEEEVEETAPDSVGTLIEEPVIEEEPEPTPVEIVEEVVEVVSPAEEEEVSLESEDSFDLNLLRTKITEGILEAAGFSNVVIKDALFSGQVFQLISFSDQHDAFIYQWNFFSEERFVGTIYEMRYPTATASFQGYLELRERSEAQSSVGEMNEVNNYGDASFYFNHFTKTKTVHLVFRKDSSVYAMEYAYGYHETMKELVALLLSKNT